MKKLITLTFLPSFPNIGILLLRLWFGIGIFWIHGLDKLIHFKTTVDQFGGMGIPSYLAVCAILAEFAGSLLLAVGLATRWAAAALGITMFVAFSQVHHFNLNPMDKMTGELAFLYLGVFTTLFITGGGRFSVDAQLSKPQPTY